MKSNRQLKIGVIGLWQLGCTYAASLAKMGYLVEGYDLDKKIIENLKLGKAPIFEPGLDKVISEHLNKNLTFSYNLDNFFNNKDYIFLTYDLPVNNKDQVSSKLIDTTVSQIIKYKGQKNIFVISSQISLGMCRSIKTRLKSDHGSGEIIYFPENVRLGKAFDTFLNPDRIILGSNSMELMDKFIHDFDIFTCPFIKMGWESAEMVKHALNSYLATCVSYSSEISDMCEIMGANMNEVVAALKTDRRVSPFAPINPGLGFAGATLGRDIQTLKRLGKSKGYITKLFKSVYRVNQDRLPWLIKKIKSIKPNLKGITIGILGLTYKPGTNTLRRSMSMELIKLLHEEGAYIRAYDPVIKEPVKGFDYLDLCQGYNTFFDDLHIVVLMTEWPEFKEAPLQEKSKLMKEKIFFDTKNFFDREKLEEFGFIYKGIGF